MIKTAGITLVILLLVAFGNPGGPRPLEVVNPPFFPKPVAFSENPPTKEGVELGRYLFYDRQLSRDSTLSCASCHRQQYAFADNKTFSTGFDGSSTTRNSMPLFNLAWYNSFFWDGRAATLEEQVFHPVREASEMNLSWKEAENRIRANSLYRGLFRKAFPGQHIDSVLVSKAIAQFLKSLVSAGSKYDRVLAGVDKFTADEYEGFILVNDQTKAACLHCHTTDADALGTTGMFSNNGLDGASRPVQYTDPGRALVTGNEADRGRFRIPSLRNVAFTAPYMHDGRFSTLQEVLEFYNSGVKAGVNTDSRMTSAHLGGVHLTAREKNQVLLFLLTLSDSAFVTNPSYSDPFTHTK